MAQNLYRLVSVILVQLTWTLFLMTKCLQLLQVGRCCLCPTPEYNQRFSGGLRSGFGQYHSSPDSLELSALVLANWNQSALFSFRYHLFLTFLWSPALCISLWSSQIFTSQQRRCPAPSVWPLTSWMFLCFRPSFTHSLSFNGWLTSFRFAAVMTSFHFLTMDLMELRGIFRIQDTFKTQPWSVFHNFFYDLT